MSFIFFKVNWIFSFFFSLSWLNFGKERGSFLWCCWPADWGTTMCDPKPCSRKIRDGWERKIRFFSLSFPPTWFSQMSESQDLRTSKKKDVSFPSFIFFRCPSSFIYSMRHEKKERKKWITFKEPQMGPFSTYSNVSNRERKEMIKRRRVVVFFFF